MWVVFGTGLLSSFADLLGLVVLGLLVLAVIVVLWKELLYATFDPLGAAASGLPVELLEYVFLAVVALTIVVSLKAVGIILVVAMLVTPAATASLLTRRFHHIMLLGALLSALASVLGLYLSFYGNVASGGAIVLVSTTLFLVVLAVTTLKARLLPGRAARPDPAIAPQGNP